MAGIHRTQAQIDRMADRKRVAQATLNVALEQVGDALLTEDELSGIEAALKRLFALAEEMGCAEKPLVEWTKQEVVRFVGLGVRAAVPLRVTEYALATDDGKPVDLPF